MKLLSALALPPFLSLLFGSSVLASPAAPLDRKIAVRSAPTSLPTIDTKTLEHFNVYAQYSASAYCSDNLHPTDQFHQIACTQFGGRCPFVEIRDSITLGGFTDNSTYQAGGYVAYDHWDNVAVIVLRGIAPSAKLEALSEKLAPCLSICPSCLCRAEVQSSWLALRSRVLALVQQARSERPKYNFIVTGHGFGGALATLAAAEIRNSQANRNGTYGVNGTTTTLYTYGSPRVGNRALAEYITNQGRNFRLTHTDDPVPKSGGSTGALAHIAPEYWNHNDNADFSVGAYQIQVFTTIEDQRGNLGNQGPDAYDPAAHIEYFMCNIGNCNIAYNQTQCSSLLEFDTGSLQYVTGG